MAVVEREMQQLMKQMIHGHQLLQLPLHFRTPLALFN